MNECLRRGLSGEDVLDVAMDFMPAYYEGIEGSDALAKKGVWLNSGVVLAKGNPMSLRDANHRLDIMTSDGNEHFIEQTLLSIASHEIGSIPWAQSEISLDVSDQFRLLPHYKKRYIARHYVGAVRHLFWLDALFV